MSLQRHKWSFLDFSNNRRQSRVNCQIVVINIFKIPAILLNSAIYNTLCYIAPCYIIKYPSNQGTILILDTQKLDSSAYRKVEVSGIQMVRFQTFWGSCDFLKTNHIIPVLEWIQESSQLPFKIRTIVSSIQIVKTFYSETEQCDNWTGFNHLNTEPIRYSDGFCV